MKTWEDLGIKVKMGNSTWLTTCPKCSPDRKKKNAPCLQVWNLPENRHFKCYHCGYSGNIDVMNKYDKVRQQSKLPEKDKMYTKIAREFIQNRGISQATAKKIGVYETSKFGKTILGWPVFMHMTLVNVKFLNTQWDPSNKFPKWTQLPKDIGTRIIPIGMHLLKPRDTEGNKIKGNILTWTEGEWDMATWYECGYENIISFPQGAPSLNAKNFDTEFAYFQDPYVKSEIEAFDLHYIFADNDEAGKRLAEHVGMIIGKEKCRIANYPIGYKDSNEVFKGNKEKGLKPLGKEGIDNLRTNVKSFPLKGIIKASHVNDDLRTIREKGFVPGLGCGTPEVDKLVTVKRKLIAFITGIPGCFASGQLIHTDKGVVPISEINKLDKVLTYNHSNKVNEYRHVLEVNKFDQRKDKLYKITLKDGTIIKVTENHEFFDGTSYVKIKDLLVHLRP